MCLAIEAVAERFIGGEVRVEQLDRDARAVARVGRLVHDAHAAAAEHASEAVVRDHLRPAGAGPCAITIVR